MREAVSRPRQAIAADVISLPSMGKAVDRGRWRRPETDDSHIGSVSCGAVAALAAAPVLVVRIKALACKTISAIELISDYCLFTCVNKYVNVH